MTERRLDEIEAEDSRVLVQVSTLEENDSDERGWVTLRIIRGVRTLDVLLETEQAKELAASLHSHALRA
jgi:hypothetical protein